MNNLKRCPWCGNDKLYVKYHDEEWGVPLKDDRKLFELLALESFQAGLSWITILRKRESFREAFDFFDPEIIVRYNSNKINELLINDKIIRNRLKIESVISNALLYLRIIGKYSSFSNYIWKFTDGKTIQNNFISISQIPARTELSDLMSKEMKKYGFRFFGSTICYAFMQSAGMVNDHLVNCFRHAQLANPK
ncbi:MAG: DNA-3-methyladenine glycosylase I [Ignavibacteria bacterium]|nr:DNA-3-methyladenine glycosylase I [Ignavibacteria bacterium]